MIMLCSFGRLVMAVTSEQSVPVLAELECH